VREEEERERELDTHGGEEKREKRREEREEKRGERQETNHPTTPKCRFSLLVF
jgi:hypothetical protein